MGKTNPTNSGMANTLIQQKFKLNRKICNYQSLLNMVYENFAYEINLNIVNNSYHIFNSNTLPLIRIIGINQYLLGTINELYCQYLQLFDPFINENYNQYYYTNIDTYNIFSTNSNLSTINNKANKSKNFISPLRNILHLKTILHFVSNGDNDNYSMLLNNQISLIYSGF